MRIVDPPILIRRAVRAPGDRIEAGIACEGMRGSALSALSVVLMDRRGSQAQRECQSSIE